MYKVYFKQKKKNNLIQGIGDQEAKTIYEML